MAIEKSKRKTKISTIIMSVAPTIMTNFGGYIITGLLFTIFLIVNNGKCEQMQLNLTANDSNNN
jgi:hypothetical protein